MQLQIYLRLRRLLIMMKNLFLYRNIFEVEKALIIMLKKLLSREEFDDDNVRYDIDDGKDDVVRGMDI